MTFPAARSLLPYVPLEDLEAHRFLAEPVAAAAPAYPTAVDYSTSRPTRAALDQVAAVACGRYVSYPGGVNKDITAAEAATLAGWGKQVFVYWENAAADALGGLADGRDMAAAARNMVRAAGGPADGGLVYFCVDFDATPAQMPAVLDWFHGIGDVLPLRQIGVYGGYYPVKAVLDAGLASKACQTRAWSTYLDANGIRQTRWDQRAELQQYSWTTLSDGSQVDLLRIMDSNYGQWDGVVDDMPTIAEINDAAEAGQLDKLCRRIMVFVRDQSGLARPVDVRNAVALLPDEATLTAIVQQAVAGIPGGSDADVEAVKAAVRAVLTDVRLSAPEPPA